MNSAKLTFLFGAGAEAEYGLPTGPAFNEALLTSKYKDVIKNVFGEGYNNIRLIYPTSTTVFYQTICENFDTAKTILSSSELTGFENYAKRDRNAGLSINEAIIKEFRTLCKGWYDMVVGNAAGGKVKEFFLQYAVFFSSLDSKFNALRVPDIDSNAKRVIFAYATVLFVMMSKLYSKDLSGFDLDKVIELLNEPYNVKKPSDTYYTILKESGLPCHIVTTNYTDLIKETSKNEEAIAWLHGKLTWIENYRELTVYDCTNASEKARILNDKEHIVPFILIPSGVKPLICRRQINEFSKFISNLDQSNILCLVGYRVNQEDNHINSIIGDWLREDSSCHILICLNYGDSINWKKVKWIEGIDIIDTNPKEISFQEHLRKSRSTILNIKTDDKTAKEDYRNLLNTLKTL